MQRSLVLRMLSLGALAFALSSPAPPALAQDTQCARPRAPEVPDGEKATDVQMIGANQRMKLYQVAVQTFLECNAKARAEIGTVARDMKLRRVDKAREEVTAELKATADKYNSQVRIYKAKKGIVDAPAEPRAEGGSVPSAEPGTEGDDQTAPAPPPKPTPGS